MSIFSPTENGFFFSKKDPLDPRLGDFVVRANGDVVLWGYPDDEGIRNNGGRPGAALGPQRIRYYFYRLTPHPSVNPQKIVDLGDLKIEGDLSSRHRSAVSALSNEISGIAPRSVSLGGGHDYAWVDGSVLLARYPQILLINFDAHLDVRPDDKGINSGTPFFRLLRDYPERVRIVQIGTQGHCNSQEHRKWAKKNGVRIISTSLLRSWDSPRERLRDLLGDWQMLPCFLSIDIDGFSTSEAPGCSQSWPDGLHWTEFQPLFRWALENLRIPHLGIYEVSPPLDVADCTSKLAAMLIWNYLFLGKA
ncbi:MAG: formimidoylglutamase [Bdellovibrionaceae bacterium]|nr:formimidoylglutamase [Pseudobdellovibrionaceae bacterium]